MWVCSLSLFETRLPHAFHIYSTRYVNISLSVSCSTFLFRKCKAITREYKLFGVVFIHLYLHRLRRRLQRNLHLFFSSPSSSSSCFFTRFLHIFFHFTTIFRSFCFAFGFFFIFFAVFYLCVYIVICCFRISVGCCCCPSNKRIHRTYAILNTRKWHAHTHTHFCIENKRV